jgi:predicted RNA-binding protein with TRAM domain
VNAAPAIANPISEYPLCDNDGDGIEVFDLTSKNTEIENGLPNITLTYYNTQVDAELGDPATEIPTPNTYPSAGAETIWVRAVNLNLCVTVSSFNLELPRVILQEVALFQVCDDSTPDGFADFDLDSQNTTINLNNPTLEVTYHLTEANAQAGTIPSIASPYTNITNNQIIWVRVFNTLTTCYRYFQMELEVISPIAGTPPPLVSCDEVPNDEFSRFDLSEADDSIINGQIDMSVTYHLTELEAEAGVGILPIVFTNTIPTNQTIYARLQSTLPGFQDCYDTIALDLIVNAAPAIADPIDPYPLCDNNQDGEEPFDLTSKNTEIENGLPNITLTYYNSEQDAIDDINPIPTSPTAPSTTNYPSTGGETIWVRAVNLDGCVTVSSFVLIIEGVYTGDYVEVPLFQVCDDDPLDGITAFDLDSQTPIIQDGDTNLDITYHESQGAADDESSSIDISIPFNSPNQTIYVRVENATTFCYDTFEMELEVISVIGVIPADIIECDEVPNDGKAIFDLTVRETDILNGQTAVLSYYELEADAEIGNPVTSITDPVNFENTTIDTQTVYVRLEEPILGCFDVVPLNLIVNAAPAIADPIDSYPLCDNNQDGEEPFDLTSKNTEIENGLPNITLTYYNSEQDAIDDINPIPTSPTAPSTTNYPSTGGETIWVRAVNLDGCVTVSSFVLIIEGVYTGDYVEVPLFQVCDDDPLDGITAFDLDSQTPIIQDGDTNLDITYHESQGAADDESSSIDISIPFNSPNQTIYVRVENATTFCYDTFEMELEVISVIGVIPADIIECDEVPNDGKAIFDLTVRETDILNGQTAVLSYYELEADAEIGNPVTSITDPVNFENTTIDTQTVYVRLEEPILGCFDVVPLNLIVNAAPAIADPIDPYPLCDNNQDGEEPFDLTSKNTEIENGLPNITLTYYNSEQDAIDDINPIPTSPTAPSTTNYPSTGGETIWVRAVNLDGCVTVSSFELIIDTVPDYTEVPLFQVCDDSNPDGQTDFDLDSQNIDIATVGGIFNPDLTVTYHLTEADAEAGTIPSLSSPFNNTNPFSQIIWVRVEDDITGCYGDFQMELLVNPLPTPLEPTPFVDCDIDNDGFIIFDLTSKDAEILDGQTGVAISYHETITCCPSMEALFWQYHIPIPVPQYKPFLQELNLLLLDVLISYLWT